MQVVSRKGTAGSGHSASRVQAGPSELFLSVCRSIRCADMAGLKSSSIILSHCASRDLSTLMKTHLCMVCRSTW